jgi:hypothetical protein
LYAVRRRPNLVYLIEENFKEIARSLAEEQTKPGTTKGRIVGHLLDTHAALKESPQGQSFYAFWNLLSSPPRQDRWRELIRVVYQTESIDPSVRENRHRRRATRARRSIDRSVDVGTGENPACGCRARVASRIRLR